MSLICIRTSYMSVDIDAIERRRWFLLRLFPNTESTDVGRMNGGNEASGILLFSLLLRLVLLVMFDTPSFVYLATCFQWHYHAYMNAFLLNMNIFFHFCTQPNKRFAFSHVVKSSQNTKEQNTLVVRHLQ